MPELIIDRREGFAVIYPEGNINNQVGEDIARAAEKLIAENYTTLLINLAGTKAVNSIGISFLVQVVERLLQNKGRLAFCSANSIIKKTFQIMGLTQYAAIFPDEAAAVANLK